MRLPFRCPFWVTYIFISASTYLPYKPPVSRKNLNHLPWFTSNLSLHSHNLCYSCCLLLLKCDFSPTDTAIHFTCEKERSSLYFEYNRVKYFTGNACDWSCEINELVKKLMKSIPDYNTGNWTRNHFLFPELSLPNGNIKHLQYVQLALA